MNLSHMKFTCNYMSIDKVLLGHNPTHSFTCNLAAFMHQLSSWSLAIEII